MCWEQLAELYFAIILTNVLKKPQGFWDAGADNCNIHLNIYCTTHASVQEKIDRRMDGQTDGWIAGWMSSQIYWVQC